MGRLRSLTRPRRGTRGPSSSSAVALFATGPAENEGVPPPPATPADPLRSTGRGPSAELLLGVHRPGASGLRWRARRRAARAGRATALADPRRSSSRTWAVAQILPGPNVVNMSVMLGGPLLRLARRLGGLRRHAVTCRWWWCWRLPCCWRTSPTRRPARARCEGWAPWPRADRGHWPQADARAEVETRWGTRQRWAWRLSRSRSSASARVPLAYVLLILGSSVCASAWFCLRQMDEHQPATPPASAPPSRGVDRRDLAVPAASDWLTLLRSVPADVDARRGRRHHRHARACIGSSWTAITG